MPADVRNILVTGATGFVGKALVAHLRKQHLPVRAAVRHANATLPDIEEYAIIGDITAQTDWTHAVAGCDVVVHLAGRAHVLREEAADPTRLFQEVNHHATVALAKAAIAAGVKRFVFISSSHVHGLTSGREPLSAASPLTPETPYGQSKADAERSLRRLCENSKMQLVIIRPPLVYGQGVKGNFERLINLVASGLPLPFACVNNQRSMIGLENLVDFITLCLGHGAAAGQAFIVADAEVTSTKQLVKSLATYMKRSLLLLPVPTTLMYVAAKMLGKKALAEALFGNLVIDSSHAKNKLNWQPPYTQQELLARLGNRNQR